MVTDFDAVIVGAGPFGLSSAAYLKKKGFTVGIFGDPMSFWQNHMPAGMFLRSNWAASHISDPDHKLTLDHFKAETGASFSQPIPLHHFIDYGKWYQQKAAPNLDRRQVKTVEKNGSGFKVTLADGEIVKSRRVVIATGIAPFPWTPREFEGLPKSHVTHSSDHCDLSGFGGKEVLVVGGGQSALDAARLLGGFGARPEIVAKQKEILWVGQHVWLHKLPFISWCLYSNFDVGPAGISRLVGFPNLFRRLPRRLQNRIGRRAVRPAGTGWQRPFLAKVPMTVNCRVVSASLDGSRVQVKLSDGTQRSVDHVIVATGYRVDTTRYSFFGPNVLQTLRTEEGYPVLGRGLESSVAGLHFVGKPAAWSFGPLLNFVSGTHFAGAEMMRHLC
ncbi:MAG TPA: NAD(P)-binding domain-containing protein [Verrucomicrobiae bacterium]|nr:NAD(P)-binding domain-containing protein [Verrucomicrobiae bacterium]